MIDPYPSNTTTLLEGAKKEVEVEEEVEVEVEVETMLAVDVLFSLFALQRMRTTSALPIARACCLVKYLSANTCLMSRSLKADWNG